MDSEAADAVRLATREDGVLRVDRVVEGEASDEEEDGAADEVEGGSEVFDRNESSFISSSSSRSMTGDDNTSDSSTTVGGTSLTSIAIGELSDASEEEDGNAGIDEDTEEDTSG